MILPDMIRRTRRQSEFLRPDGDPVITQASTFQLRVTCHFIVTSLPGRFVPSRKSERHPPTQVPPRLLDRSPFLVGRDRSPIEGACIDCGDYPGVPVGGPTASRSWRMNRLVGRVNASFIRWSSEAANSIGVCEAGGPIPTRRAKNVSCQYAWRTASRGGDDVLDSHLHIGTLQRRQLLHQSLP